MQPIVIDWNLWIVIIMSIVAAGMLGGTASWLIGVPSLNGEQTESPVRWGPVGHAFLGIAAASTVPFVLTTLQSDLLSTPAKILEPKTVLTFFGICVVVAFASRRFMSTISENLLRQLRESQRTSEEALTIAKQAEELSDEVHENFTEASQPPTPRATPPVGFTPPDLTPAEQRALRASGLMSRRTRTGIAKDAQLSVSTISEVIDSLIRKGLIRRTRSESTGGLRFEITEFGINTLNAETST